MTYLNRRGFLGATAAVAGAAFIGASGCGSRPTSGSGGVLQFTWWGNPDRDQRTKKAIEAYQNKYDGQVTPQFTGWDGYWEKLATQTAGGQPPDVIQMDYAYLSEYVQRNVLETLDSYVPDTLKVGDWDDSALAGGRIDGKLYGINAGTNSMAMIYNASMLEELKLDKPDDTITWEEFAELCKKIAAKTPDGVFGTMNGALETNPFECWLRQRGKDLYTKDGELGYGETELTEWYEFWEDLRKSGAAATAEAQLSGSGDIEDSLPIKRKAVFTFAHSNQLNAFTTVSKDKVDATMYPAGKKPGQYYKPSMLFSVAAKSDSKQEAVKLVNAMLTEPKVARSLGTERGVPEDDDVRKDLEAELAKSEQAVFDYIDRIEDKVGPTPPPPPPGGTEIDETVYPFAGEQIAYGKTTIPKAIRRYLRDAEKALS